MLLLTPTTTPTTPATARPPTTSVPAPASGLGDNSGGSTEIAHGHDRTRLDASGRATVIYDLSLAARVGDDQITRLQVHAFRGGLVTVTAIDENLAFDTDQCRGFSADSGNRQRECNG